MDNFQVFTQKSFAKIDDVSQLDISIRWMLNVCDVDFWRLIKFDSIEKYDVAINLAKEKIEQINEEIKQIDEKEEDKEDYDVKLKKLTSALSALCAAKKCYIKICKKLWK